MKDFVPFVMMIFLQQYLEQILGEEGISDF